jgi:hypothetical protein
MTLIDCMIWDVGLCFILGTVKDHCECVLYLLVKLYSTEMYGTLYVNIICPEK